MTSDRDDTASRLEGDPLDDDVALLSPGQSLGRYAIVGLLGKGGMGRVYRAMDPTLGREVAIKALASVFHKDAENLRRFEREARALAALNHPAIATIYGFELLEGAPYLVLELVEGETLHDRLDRGRLPVPDAIEVARQVAEALEEAHRKGVIHRDLKPPNVMLAEGGRVKVLDFGLAKTLPRHDSDPKHTATSRLATASGTVLGTAPYMSPEQVRGASVDTRTDVWSFGCVLYEMLSGRRAFQGRSVPDIMASVLRDEVDWAALPPETPHALRRLLDRCLRKDPHDRLQDVGDARLELAEMEAAPADEGVPVVRRLGGRAPWVVAVLSLLAGAAAFLRAPSPAPLRAVRLGLELPRSVRLSDDFHPPFALSPDGAQIALVGVEGEQSRIFLRPVGELALRALPGTEGARQPFFSPDGRWLGFFAERKLKKVRLDGGGPVVLAEVGGNLRGATWTPRGTIVFSPSQTSGLQSVPDRGGRPTALTTLDAQHEDASHRWPEVLPGGRWVLYTVGVEDGSYDDARLEAVSLETGERRTLVANAAFGRHLAGTLLFARAGMLLGVPFTAGNPAVEGDPEVVLEGIRYDPRNGAAHLAVSASGTVIYVPGAPVPPERHLAWLDRSGRLTRLLDAPRRYGQPRLSREGERIALRIGAPAASDLWSLDVANATLTRVSTGDAVHRPAWRPDGRTVTVGAAKDGRWRLLSMPASGEPSVLFEGAGRMYPNDWTPDGRFLVFQERVPQHGWDLRRLEVDEDGRAVGPPRPVSATPAHEASGALSPDGALLAYESDEVDDVVEVYVRAFPEGEEKVRASNGGARAPRWGPDGRLYYWSSSAREFQMVSARQQAGRIVVDVARPVFGELAFAADRLMISTSDGFDVDRAGRFLVLEPQAATETEPPGRAVVILNWDGRRSGASARRP